MPEELKKENKQYYEAVVENIYNFFASFYVGQKDTREKIDIVKLNVEIKEDKK